MPTNCVPRRYKVRRRNEFSAIQNRSNSVRKKFFYVEQRRRYFGNSNFIGSRYRYFADRDFIGRLVIKKFFELFGRLLRIQCHKHWAIVLRERFRIRANYSRALIECKVQYRWVDAEARALIDNRQTARYERFLVKQSVTRPTFGRRLKPSATACRRDFFRRKFRFGRQILNFQHACRNFFARFDVGVFSQVVRKYANETEFGRVLVQPSFNRRIYGVSYPNRQAVAVPALTGNFRVFLTVFELPNLPVEFDLKTRSSVGGVLSYQFPRIAA